MELSCKRQRRMFAMQRENGVGDAGLAPGDRWPDRCRRCGLSPTGRPAAAARSAATAAEIEDRVEVLQRLAVAAEGFLVEEVGAAAARIPGTPGRRAHRRAPAKLFRRHRIALAAAASFISVSFRMEPFFSAALIIRIADRGSPIAPTPNCWRATAWPVVEPA